MTDLRPVFSHPGSPSAPAATTAVAAIEDAIAALDTALDLLTT